MGGDEIPAATGRPMDDWLQAVDNGPGLVRCEELADWLRREYGIPAGYAKAIVHEHALRRAARKLRCPGLAPAHAFVNMPNVQPLWCPEPGSNLNRYFR